MSANPTVNEALTRKLLRFGTDNPRCAVCKLDDARLLCSIESPGKPNRILCANCKSKTKQLSAKSAAQKARRFENAGYFKLACIICNDPTLQILELDHVAHVANSSFVAPLCANHHAIKSFLAGIGPMAALRLRDPERSALQLQAAFEFGLGLVLSMFAIVDGLRDETARSVCFGVAAGLLFGWALWNVAADKHFENVLGRGYDRAIPAAIPR